jgi:hypothetical protein
LFESLEIDDAAARMRRAALPPLIAFLLALLYLTLYPLFGRVPKLLFWLVVLVLFAGTVGGLIAIVRAGRPRGRALAWFAAAIVMELVCARMLLGMALPWL